MFPPASLLLAALAATAGPGQDPAAPLQVLLFWGGGAPRSWQGTLSLEGAGEDSRVSWLWLMDHEDGDAFEPGPGWPPVDQRVPLSLADSPSVTGTEGPTRLRTHTEGDADGVAFEWHGSRDAALRLVVDGATLECTLTDLLDGPRVMPADNAGNVVLAKAIDLGRVAPLSVGAGGERHHRACLHGHTCASTGERPLAAEVRSLAPFVRQIWWTDHNHTSPRFLLAGSFDDAQAVQRYWRVAASGAALVESAERVAEDGRGGVFQVRARALHGMEGAVTVHHPYAAGLGNLFTAVWLGPVLTLDWYPPEQGAAFVQVLTNTGRTLRYLSAPVPGQDPDRDLVVPAEGGRWQVLERDLRADLVARWPEAAGDGLHHVSFGLVCAGDGPAEARFDAFRLALPEGQQRTAALLEGYRSIAGVRTWLGMEQSAWNAADAYGGLHPHLTLLMPGEDMAGITGFDHPPSAAERGERIRRCQEAGGVVGAHHLHQGQSFDVLFEAPEWNLDLFEVGGAWLGVPAYPTEADRRGRESHSYPERSRDEVFPLLVRWDRALARGLWLTGYGAPDLHEEFHRSSLGFFNRWLTDVIAAGDGPADLLQALRRGQATGTEWHSEARLGLRVDGRPWMGRVVVTDRSRVPVEVVVQGALPGSRVRWIRGDFGAARPDGAVARDADPAVVHGADRLAAADGTLRTELDVAGGRFLRAELYNPAGHLVAFTNPVGVTPFLPEDLPPERLAFLWQDRALDGAVAAERQQATDLADLPRRALRSIPPRKETYIDWDVGDPAQDPRTQPQGLGPAVLLGDTRQMRKFEGASASFALPLPAGRECWLKLVCRFPPDLGGVVHVDGQEVGRFPPRSAPVVRVPPLDAPDRVRLVTVTLDREPAAPLEQPHLERVRVYVGEGVVDY